MAALDLSDLGPQQSSVLDLSDLGPSQTASNDDNAYHPGYLAGVKKGLKESPGIQFLESVVNSYPETVSHLGNFFRRLHGDQPEKNLADWLPNSNPNSLASIAGGSILPTAVTLPIGGPIESLVGAAAKPLVGNLASKGLGIAASGAATAPAYGVDPLTGAFLGPATHALLHGGASLVNNVAQSQPLKQLVLYLANKTGLNAPAEAANNFSQNLGSHPLAPIGDVANSTTLKHLMDALEYIPGSGAQTASDLMFKDLARQKYNTFGNQIDESNQQLQDLLNHPNEAPEFSDNQSKLAKDAIFYMNPAGKPENATYDLAQTTRNLAEQNKVIDRANYAKVDDNQRLDQVGEGIPMPTYADSAAKLAANQQNLKNVFGSDSDVAQTIRSETAKAQHFLENGGREFGLTVGEARTRIQNLGDAAESAKQQGNFSQARLLNDLKHSFKNDFETALGKVNPQMLSDLKTANDFHRKNVRPFYRKGVLLQTFNGSTPENDTLAKTLLKKNNEDLWDKLPNDKKRSVLQLLLTKGNTSNINNAKDLGNSWNNISDYAKSKIKEFDPYLHDYLNNAKNYSQKELERFSNKNEMYKGSEKIRNSQISALQNEIESLRNSQSEAQNKMLLGQRNGTNLVKQEARRAALFGAAPAAYFFPHLFLGAAGLVGGSNLLQKALTSPEVREAFIKGEKLSPKSNAPISQDVIDKLRSHAVKTGSLATLYSLLNPGANNQ